MRHDTFSPLIALSVLLVMVIFAIVIFGIAISPFVNPRFLPIAFVLLVVFAVLFSIYWSIERGTG